MWFSGEIQQTLDQLLYVCNIYYLCNYSLAVSTVSSPAEVPSRFSLSLFSSSLIIHESTSKLTTLGLNGSYCITG